MEERDQELVRDLWDKNPRFRKLFEEHQLLEKELNNLGEKSFLSPEEELEKKKMQKLKLAGKDEMEQILSSHRQ
ncbi:MAG: DUF465 domain-containing protein [Desulfuromonas sp.]|nr:MAG: DUF465 domain-containing protein [Desulfuromonas sp.]